jgi:ring-1,2-phenylacetyl-CoA epoxidase subunit PaaD
VVESALERAWDVLSRVEDPEIPVLSIVDLGVVRWVKLADEELCVGLTPTYTGCPATLRIRADAVAALHSAGFYRVRTAEVLSPAWSTDWISEEGNRKLREYGIAPPVRKQAAPRCPRCGSTATELVSEFGSTPCKSLHRCTDCLEPFDSFKCI